MRNVMPLALALLTAPALAAPRIALDVPLPLTGEPAAVRAEAADFFRSDEWRSQDPTLENATALDVKVRRFRGATLLRATPALAGVTVEGADRIAVVRDGRVVRGRFQAPLVPRSSFVLTGEEAVAVAAAQVPDHLFTDPTVERLGGFAQKVWLARGEGVRAAWRVRVPTLSLRTLSDVWVDAEDGRVLYKQQVAKFQTGDAGVTDAGDADGGTGETDAGAGETDAGAGETDAGAGETDAGAPDAGPEPEVDAGPPPAAPTAAKVFQYAPNPGTGVMASDLVEVDLTALRPGFIGDYLRGDYVETYNCCKEYVCLDGSSECELADRRCATEDDVEPILSELNLEVPTAQFQDQVPFLPDVLYAKGVFCSELPKLTSEDDGWTPTPVDQTRETNEVAGLASETDAFAEVQAYYSTMVFFQHIRSVIDDDTWCLGGNSMACEDDGTPTLGGDGKPSRPYHVAVNFLIPELDFEVLAQQLLGGRGSTPGNPILIEDYQRVDNAAFVPALSGSPIDVPPELEDLVDIFNREYDSNIYFQGQRDFAYDGDIVFHEFTHAIVFSYVPTLGSLWHDKWGMNAFPGALNEGWSDYFSMSFTDDPATAEYGGAGLVEGELSLRDATAGKKCPDNIIGQVHGDSQPFSSALWKIREAVVAAEGASAVAALDASLLLAMAESDDNESFEAQAARVLDVVEATFDAALRTQAETAFAETGVTGCERVHPLSELDGSGEAVVNTRDELFLNGPGEVGLQQAAPSAMQFRIDVPVNATQIGVRWRQQNGGIGDFANAGGEDAAVPKILLDEIDGPIEWRYEGPDGDLPVAYDGNGDTLGFNPNDPNLNGIVSTPNNNGISTGNFDLVLESDPCNAREFWLQFVSTGPSLRVTNLEVQFDTADEACTDGPGGDAGPGDDIPEDCQCSSSTGDDALPVGLALVLVLPVLLRRRRRGSPR